MVVNAREMMEIERCPCGATPSELGIAGGQCPKWAWCFCPECSEWHIEFRNDYNELTSEETMERAIEAWNAAPRDGCYGKWEQ